MQAASFVEKHSGSTGRKHLRDSHTCYNEPSILCSDASNLPARPPIANRIPPPRRDKAPKPANSRIKSPRAKSTAISLSRIPAEKEKRIQAQSASAYLQM